jgi:hypothetical protein
MSTPDTKPLAVDPYAHQPDGDWKLTRQRDDVEMLCRVLSMEPDSVRAASAQYKGREADLFRFLFAMRFLDHVNRIELKEEASILRVLSVIFAIEGIAAANLGNRERLKGFLAKYLDQKEKLTLLHGYLFTPKYPLGGNRGKERHLMFGKAMADAQFRGEELQDKEPEYCSPGQYPGCFCTRWLSCQENAVLDDFTAQFGEKLYEMRSAVTHEAKPVLFGEARDREPENAASWSSTLWDAYSVRDGHFVTYETGLPVPDTVRILMGGVRRCFEDGSRF